MDGNILIDKYFWIAFIVVTFINYVVLKIRVKPLIEKDASLEEGYNKILNSIVTWGNLPWVIMGYGIVTNHVSSISDYMKPQEMNPYVLLFVASIFLIYILLLRWIFFKEGAEMLLKHKGIFNKGVYGRDSMSVKTIKFYSLLIVFIGVVVTIF